MIDGLILAPSIALLALWTVTLISDLRHRSIAIPALLALTVLSLIGQTWPWWLLTSAMLLWPSRRSAILLAPIAIGVGVVTNSPAPGMAIAAGSAAWALGWWGGADSIALAVLALRYGLIGVLVGASAVSIIGLLVMLRRRRTLLGLLTVIPEAIALQARDSAEIPAEAELPAAAVLAVAGLVLEIVTVVSLVKP